MRIGNGSRGGQVDNVGETSVEEVDGGDQASHVDWSTRVGNAVCWSGVNTMCRRRGKESRTWNVDEKFGESTKGVRDSLPPQRDGRDQAFVNTRGV
jgi:hypothetical protein